MRPWLRRQLDRHCLIRECSVWQKSLQVLEQVERFALVQVHLQQVQNCCQNRVDFFTINLLTHRFT